MDSKCDRVVACSKMIVHEHDEIRGMGKENQYHHSCIGRRVVRPRLRFVWKGRYIPSAGRYCQKVLGFTSPYASSGVYGAGVEGWSS